MLLLYTALTKVVRHRFSLLLFRLIAVWLSLLRIGRRLGFRHYNPRPASDVTVPTTGRVFP